MLINALAFMIGLGLGALVMYYVLMAGFKQLLVDRLLVIKKEV